MDGVRSLLRAVLAVSMAATLLLTTLALAMSDTGTLPSVEARRSSGSAGSAPRADGRTVGPAHALQTSDAPTTATESLVIEPREAPVPELELSESAQSLVLVLQLTTPTSVELIESAVSLVRPPARVGGPELINVQALDELGGVVESYNDWHPLWVAEHGHGDDEGEHDHSLVIAETGVARIIVRFDPVIEMVRVTDIVEDDQPIQLAEIDVGEIITDYCAEHPDDPACQADEGCGAGYWRNALAPWSPTGYSPFQTIGSVFGNANEDLASTSLRDALGLRGGRGVLGVQMILLRQAVAALLNAAHPSVNYAWTETDVIAEVNGALAGDRSAMLALATTLDGLNDEGCPLDASGQLTEQ
jgi:hypothetical protein